MRALVRWLESQQDDDAGTYTAARSSGGFQRVDASQGHSTVLVTEDAGQRFRASSLTDLNWSNLHGPEGEDELAVAREKFRTLKKLHKKFKADNQDLFFRTPPEDHSRNADNLQRLSSQLMESELAAFWQTMRPMDFVLILEALRPTCEEADFLVLLSVPCLDKFVGVDSKESCFVKPCSGKEDLDTSCFGRIKNFCAAIPNAIASCCESRKRVSYHVQFSAAMHVYPKKGSARDRAFVLRALLDSHSCDLFQTAVGLGISHRAWESKKGHNRVAIVGHLIMILLLLHFGNRAYHKHLPHSVALNLYLVMFFAEGVCRIAEVVGALCLYGAHGHFLAGIKRYFMGFWSTSYMVMHWVALLITAHMVWSLSRHEDLEKECNAENKCWYHEHNVCFMVLVMAKCAGLLIRLLSWQAFGEASLPAINAVKARRTVYFMAFLLAFWLCAAAAFFVQPISMQEQSMGICAKMHHTEFGKDLCKGLIYLDKMFNVAVMGQFEISELENVKQELSGTVSHGNQLRAHLEQGDWTDYHVGAEVWQLLVGFTVNILALNVFISIVSMEYNKYAGAAVAHLMQFRSNFIFRTLLMQVVWEKVKGSLRCWREPQPGMHPQFLYIKTEEWQNLQGPEEVESLREENRVLWAEVVRLRERPQASNAGASPCTGPGS